MLVYVVQSVIVILLGFLFAYLYGFIDKNDLLWDFRKSQLVDRV